MVTSAAGAEPTSLQRGSAYVADYFSFTRHIEARDYRRRILVLMAAATVSLAVFPSEALHSVITLGLAVPLSGLIVRRLRTGGMRWWLVFLGLIPVLGWIIISALVSRPAPEPAHPDDDHAHTGRKTVAKVVVAFVATYVTIALLVVPTTLAVGRENTVSHKSVESVGPVDVEASKKDPSDTESLSVPQ